MLKVNVTGETVEVTYAGNVAETITDFQRAAIQVALSYEPEVTSVFLGALAMALVDTEALELIRSGIDMEAIRMNRL